jgi:hypothetical protein
MFSTLKEIILLGKEKFMESKWTGLREIRENIQPGLSSGEESALRLEQEVHDIERCLAGDPTSNLWQDLSVKLTNKKEQLLHMKRRLAGRTPQMESWEYPLPG